MPDMITTQLVSTSTFGTNATGVMVGQSLTTDARGVPEFVNFQNTFSEYRVLAIEWNWLPIFSAGYITSTDQAPLGAVATRHDTSISLPLSVAALINTPTHTKWSAAKPITKVWKMNGVDEAGFQPTIGANTSAGGTIFYLDNGSNSRTFGRFYLTFLVQFKGRR
jgi:hypothetical protein